MITGMRGYIRDRLARQATGSDEEPAFGWELEDAHDPLHRQRKRIQLAMDLGLFILAGIVAGAWAVTRQLPPTVWPLLAFVADLLIGCYLANQFVIYSGLRRHKTGRASQINKATVDPEAVSS
jgi:hypothetical protein